MACELRAREVNSTPEVNLFMVLIDSVRIKMTGSGLFISGTNDSKQRQRGRLSIVE
jgi:hypothetical protein